MLWAASVAQVCSRTWHWFDAAHFVFNIFFLVRLLVCCNGLFVNLRHVAYIVESYNCNNVLFPDFMLIKSGYACE